MEEREAEKLNSVPLDYATPSNPNGELLTRNQKRGALLVGTYALAIILVICSEYFSSFKTLFRTLAVLVLFFAVFLGFYFMVIDPLRKKREWKSKSAAEYDNDWDAMDSQRKEMVANAQRIYAKGPMGSWRIAMIEHRVPGVVKLMEERAIKFLPGGLGIYQWNEAGNFRKAIETTFEYRWDVERRLIVRISSPPTDGWHSVEFGFEAKCDDQKVLDLYLWFESENPMPLGLTEYWPFQGEYQRMPE